MDSGDCALSKCALGDWRGHGGTRGGRGVSGDNIPTREFASRPCVAPDCPSAEK